MFQQILLLEYLILYLFDCRWGIVAKFFDAFWFEISEEKSGN
jgi:hypothetical protein